MSFLTIHSHLLCVLLIITVCARNGSAGLLPDNMESSDILADKLKSILTENGPKLLNHKSATADDIRKIKADHGFKIKHFDFQSSYMAKSVDNESHLLTFVNVEYVQVTAKFEVNQKNLTTSDLAAALHLVRKSLLKGFRKDETRQLYKITEKGLKNLSDFYVTDAVIEQPENLHPLVVNIHFTFEILANELSEIKKN